MGLLLGLTWMHVQGSRLQQGCGQVVHEAGRVGKTVQDKCLCQRSHLILQRADLDISAGAKPSPKSYTKSKLIKDLCRKGINASRRVEVGEE